MSKEKNYIAKKKFNFNKIKIYNQKRNLLLNTLRKQKNISYVILEKDYCKNITTDSKSFNPVTRGCLKAIFAFRSINPKKIILKPSLLLPEFISEEAFDILWLIADIKPLKNFARTFKVLEDDISFINAFITLAELLCEEPLRDVDLFKNTESMILHEVWV